MYIYMYREREREQERERQRWTGFFNACYTKRTSIPNQSYFRQWRAEFKLRLNNIIYYYYHKALNTGDISCEINRNTAGGDNNSTVRHLAGDGLYKYRNVLFHNIKNCKSKVEKSFALDHCKTTALYGLQ